MILLDTHVLLWTDDQSGRLGSKAVALIREHQGRQWCSAISLWEVAMLVSKGRINLSLPLDSWAQRVRAQGGVRVAKVSAEIAYDAGTLAGDIHGDPCDRIMIATARALNCALLTADRKILDYAARGHVQAIDAGR